MPHRVSSNGSFRLDRTFVGVGRLALASGATSVGEYRKRNALLTRLFDMGRLDLLRALRDRTLSVTEVYAADREGKLDSLTGDRAALNANLFDAVKKWVPTSASALGTRNRYKTSFTALERSNALKSSARVNDLAGLDWKALEQRWPNGASDWNHLRRAVSHFLAQHLGDVTHPLRRAVVKAIPLRREISRAPDLTPALFQKIIDAVPEPLRAAYVTIAMLGLRVGEYLRLRPEHLLPHTLGVSIPGTKTVGSTAVLRVDERLWPWVVAAVPSPLSYKHLRLNWKAACKKVEASSDLRLHDLRHCYGQWLAEAGVAENRIQTGLRHSTALMTRKYTTSRDQGETAKVMGDVLSLVKSIRSA